jgi:hypothetical protein
LALVGLCLAIVEHPGPLRITLAFIAIILLAVISRQTSRLSAMNTFAQSAELAARMAFQLPVDMLRTRRWLQTHGKHNAQPVHWLTAWMTPVLLSLVFVALFALANPVISDWTRRLAESIRDLAFNASEYLAPIRILLWLVTGFVVWSLLRGRTRLRRRRQLSMSAAAPARTRRVLREETILRCLIVFNLLFATQMAIDLTTVLSEGRNLPEGVTYSEYARRGAYPLVATALLSAAFVLATFPAGPRNSAGRWPRRLVYLWVAQNILLTASAAWRLRMYIDAFGLTRLRVAAAIWMLLVAIGLILILWRIRSDRANEWLVLANVLTLGAVLYACCFINFDRLIAWHGVMHCREIRGDGPAVDLRYQSRLGIDAIPSLTWLASRLGENDRVGREAGIRAQELNNGLTVDLQSWRGWTLRRSRLGMTQLPTAPLNSP